MIKHVFAPHLGRTVRLGRRRSLVPKAPLRLAKYLCPVDLPTPPEAVDYSAKAMLSLSSIFENDRLGDCVIACGYHVTGVETGNAGDLFVPTDAQIIADYSAIGGYVPGDPSTDNGCVIQDALDHWRVTGFANGTKLLGSVSVDASNPVEWRTGLWLFENAVLGIELPDPWIGREMPSASGFQWDTAGAPNPDNGHCIGGVGYDKTGIKIATWGLLGTITTTALAAYAVSRSGGEIHIALSPDQLAKGQAKAPNGIAWDDLLSDFQKFGTISA